jgi:hypothetical protein
VEEVLPVVPQAPHGDVVGHHDEGPQVPSPAVAPQAEPESHSKPV